MNVRIEPSVARGVISAPPSKSCAHRLLICAALSDGESVIENIGFNDDINATADCLRVMGAQIEFRDNLAYVNGIGNKERCDELALFCNESGSTLRFLIPLSLGFSRKTEFSGKGRLMERPQSIYEVLLTEKGCKFTKGEDKLSVEGYLGSGIYELPGNVSSQFITGLLFTLPLLDGDSEIVLTTELQSAPYVDITIDILSKFGIEISRDDNRYLVKGNQKYKSTTLTCEGDWSNGAFLDAFNLAGGCVSVTGLNDDSFQGDKAYRDFYKKLSEGYCEIDISQCPDLGPVLVVCAAIKNGAVIHGTDRLKIKESDRASAMAEELKRFGINAEIGDNKMIIPNTPLKAPTEAVCCHNDHRIAMSFAVLCSITGGELVGAECVNKSYPEFFRDIEKIGITYTEI